jgi:hypothetical protein
MMPFACSICEQESTQICERCTKDVCSNHLCVKCRRCSDCCECEEPLAESPDAEAPTVAETRQAPAPPQSALVGGTEPLETPQASLEPSGIPAEDISGEASDKDLP